MRVRASLPPWRWVHGVDVWGIIARIEAVVPLLTREPTGPVAMAISPEPLR